MKHTKELCPYCNGTGLSKDHDGCVPPTYFLCEFCDGTGKRKEWKTSKQNPFIIEVNKTRNTRINCPSKNYAQRIIKCVDACINIENEKLTVGYVKSLEEENDRLKGLVKNLDNRLITNGIWEDV